jgi:exonuclease SbcC
MIPVRLELQNFLSYGTEAPPLEFDAFDVACLSGGNGEGKSALLDAMTWAVWGEARKSSGKRKPDDELIRIGSRHMEVTFTFDLEDTRYRVTRSFSRSATGKTTSSDLEFQLYAPDEGAYRPLTGSTQRETQARIDDTLGIDYDTFINSAFLLQGRSDEFTQKSPSQRKEILVSILNLSRYETLEDRARDRWREAKHQQQRAEAEVERLQEALADVPDWKEKREEARTAVEEKQEELATRRDREKALTQQRADLEAKAREAESVRQSIADLEDRIEENREERAALDEKIADADELLADKEDIEAAYDRYRALQDERDALDEKRDLHRGIEKQIEQKKAALQERTNAIERRLDRLKVERNGFEQNLDDCETKLAKRPAVVDALRAAQAARQQVREREAVRRRRDALRRRQEEAERALVGARQQLQGELESLQTQIEDEREAVQKADALDARIEELKTKKERRDALGERLEALEKKGKSVAQAVQERAGQLEAKREEREQEQAELRRFRRAEGPTCPTCGTDLTPTHREEVERTLQSSIQQLEATLRQHEEALAEKKERRDALRRRYAELREKRQALEGVGETLATVREQRRALDETTEALERHRQRAAHLQQQLQRRTYGAAHRRRWQWCAQRLAALQVDDDRFADLQNRAAQFDRYVDRLRELNELEGRQNELRRKIDEHEADIESLRQQLDEGPTVVKLETRIDELQDQLDDVDFDPERFQEVRRALQSLSDIEERVNELKNAKRNRDDWQQQRARLDGRLDDLKEERDEAAQQLEQLEAALENKGAVDDQLDAAAEAVEEAEQALNEAQQRLGMLNERLDQAARDEEALEEAESELQECKKNRRLYKHLRTAFGKHGIPSLIIEETLPEIEERANDILDRLTDGRMHVRLETLKEKKSGGTKETLEIIITDEQGVPRPYETFSGGESFRVNFALRVALAQLLAERSGVRVRTLVIDEGFGTQDEDGIERLVEAIQAIREDFAKIIVITHLERLKQSFPVRIEVEKDPVVGSTFELVGA